MRGVDSPRPHVRGINTSTCATVCYAQRAKGAVATRGREGEGGGVVEILMPPINALNVTLIAISRSPVGLCAQINIVCWSQTHTHTHARVHTQHTRARTCVSCELAKYSLYACLANISVPWAHTSLRSRSARIITNYRRWWNTPWKRVTVISKWVVAVSPSRRRRLAVARRELPSLQAD